ncbi:MAG: peptide chain release factor N(5)-glutamine methyltransferase [Gammaproteobacteria bacterium]|nr:peptide chain release factor N(5)-glutamine methyltransferase [Gammaproteobacteria bacterium]
MTTIRDSLRQALTQLRPHSDSAQLDAEILLCLAIKKLRLFLFSHPEYILSETQSQQFQALIQQRLQGIPIAYLTGQREFWSLSLQVSPHTLIPRPETELLVERVLSHLHGVTQPRILELGTGSGAIALAIATERSDCQLTAIDISQKAIEMAKQNAHALQLESIEFYQSDWFANVPPHQRFHLIVSNPPYLSPDDPHLLEGDLRFEPQLALISEQQGLAALSHLIQHAPHFLEANGWLCLEHGHTQQESVQQRFKQHGYTNITTHLDIQDHGRVTEGNIQLT